MRVGTKLFGEKYLIFPKLLMNILSSYCLVGNHNTLFLVKISKELVLGFLYYNNWKGLTMSWFNGGVCIEWLSQRSSYGLRHGELK